MSDIKDLLSVLSDPKKYEEQVSTLTSLVEKSEEMYKLAQAERGKLQVEKEELEKFKSEYLPKKADLEKREKIVKEKEEAFNYMVATVKTKLKGK